MSVESCVCVQAALSASLLLVVCVCFKPSRDRKREKESIREQNLCRLVLSFFSSLSFKSIEWAIDSTLLLLFSCFVFLAFLFLALVLWQLTAILSASLALIEQTLDSFVISSPLLPWAKWLPLALDINLFSELPRTFKPRTMCTCVLLSFPPRRRKCT